MSGESATDMWTSSLVLWDGPESLSTREESASAFVYGWQVLRLAVRTDHPRVLEARSLYTNPRRDAPVAILRAVYWHSHLPGFAPGTAPVAARFVEVPRALALQWIAAFDGVSAVPQRAFDPALPTRTVRIEWDYVASAFEVAWQGGELERSALAAAWQVVWKELGTALGRLPEALDIEEDWRLNLNHIDEPPFTTSRRSTTTAYQLDTYPPLGQQARNPSRQTPP